MDNNIDEVCKKLNAHFSTVIQPAGKIDLNGLLTGELVAESEAVFCQCGC